MDFAQQLIALGQIVVIDLVLAGDNAIVVGLAASRVHPALRARVIFWGMAGAVLLRVSFAAVATHLLMIVGLTLAGGILLLWVCWKMYREIRFAAPVPAMAGGGSGFSDAPSPTQPMAFKAALIQIIIADVSMSLDNVLAVAGAAREHPAVLIFGLSLSILLMGVAARAIASLLHKFRWLAYVGLAVILYVAFGMIVRGAAELQPVFSAVVGYLTT